MWWFKKKKTILNNRPEQLRANARRKGELNLLSDAQIESVLEKNQDLDFLDSELKEQMNYPDVTHLIANLVPQNMRRTARKPVSVEDIMLGAICGDIIGSKFEFTTHDYEAARHMKLPDRKSYHTDDTVLTRATR